jgi:hypothetical protein
VRVLRIILCWMLAAPWFSAHAQMWPFPGPGRPEAGSRWTFVQAKYYDSMNGGTGGSACSANGTTCTVNVSAIGNGHVVIVASIAAVAGSAITLVGISSETTTHCGNCNFGSSSSGWVDARYVLSATGGETTITCTVNMAPTSYFGCLIAEFSYSGPSASYDTSNGAVLTGCTTCAGASLALKGSKDIILQVGSPANSFGRSAAGSSQRQGAGFKGVSGSYIAIPPDAPFPSGAGLAYLANTADGAAPNWTQSPAGDATVMGIAIKGN